MSGNAKPLRIVAASALPQIVTANTIYYVKIGDRIQHYITDSNNMLYPINSPPVNGVMSPINVAALAESIMYVFYTVPTDKSTYGGLNFTINNIDSTPDSLNIAIVPNGQTLSAEHIVVNNALITLTNIPNASFTIHVDLNEGDKIYVSSTNGSLNVFMSSYEVSMQS